ncbi:MULTISPECIES: hypothetical protein [unclassified Beijerinckia]|uniref:hypothetical protein n=1 Tax=unclassified Beijerinckia TaxID=2638183 RepID=UPI000894B6B8|nr:MULTISPECIES: hypothetical protein [unclassified Beijerinckia]MDH7794374.1 hypothetical protein [Beijerinckia sp. GAS462]SEB60314.1 hypothetical protein SAMN05443249_0643 [Beijerinckia sp. 28-YEA-48]
MSFRLLSRLSTAVSLLLLPAIAEAKLARCFTTSDGYYDCDFRATDKDGSFEISAKRKPRYILVMEEPGLASAFVNLGTDRNVSLPGKFKRNKQDLACWFNDESRTRICAW